jgi:hypothetical protein
MGVRVLVRCCVLCCVLRVVLCCVLCCVVLSLSLWLIVLAGGYGSRGHGFRTGLCKYCKGIPTL